MTRVYKDMTWKDIEAFIEASHGNAAIMIPIGCMEEHGPHLPLATDGMIAMAFAAAVARDDSLPVVAGPLVDFGESVLTQGFVGSIKIRFDTLRALLVDIMRSCVAWGFTKIILWTWHGGTSHDTCLREASLQILSEIKVDIYEIRGVKIFDDPDFKKRIESVLDSLGDHADELETSLMMYLHPDLVKKDLLVKEYPDLPKFKIIDSGRPYMNHGVIGDATLATAEKGNRIFDMMLEHLLALVRAMVLE
ncbi:MAG: creatininase family protein [Candidatus Lokiarchaeota archaeon]|nr:creatininase family protein [Candidatus Lokiarchaeota archaeon]